MATTPTYKNAAGYTATPNANATPAQIATGITSLTSQGFTSSGGSSPVATTPIAPATQTDTTAPPVKTGTPVTPQNATQVGEPQPAGTPVATTPKTATASAQPQPIPSTDIVTLTPDQKASNAKEVADIKARQKASFDAANASGKEAPANAGEARTASAEFGASVEAPQQDPITNAVNTATTNFITSSNALVSYESTMQSVGSYQLEASNALGIPALQVQDMNIKNIMAGTEDDIRSEVTAAGGTATESQVEGMTITRNKVLVKQATNIENQLSIAQNTLSNDVAAFQGNQTNAISALRDSASNSQTFLSLVQGLQTNAQANYNKIVTNVGYTGLAANLAGNTQGLASAEASLGLSSGSLSNPTSLKALETNRQKSLELSQARVNITLGNIPGISSPSVPGITNGVSMIPSDTSPTAVIPNTGGMNYGAITLAAHEYLATGKTDTTANRFAQGVITSEASVIQSELGLSDSDVVTMRESYGADLSSLTSIQTNADAAQSSETKTNLNLKLAQTLSKSVPRSGSPLANNYLLWEKGQLKGDTPTAKFEVAVYTAASEYAKVVGGSPSGGGSLTDSARAEADKLLSAAYSQDTFDGVVGVMQQDMDNTISSYGSQISAIKSRTLGGGQTSDGSVQSAATAAGYDYQAMIKAGMTDDQIQSQLNSLNKK